MSSLFECSVLAPAWLCHHRDLLVYLVPSVLLALLIRALSARHPFFFLFTLAGTICHELAHFVAAKLTGARPAAFTVIPRRVGQGWELGSVRLTRAGLACRLHSLLRRIRHASLRFRFPADCLGCSRIRVWWTCRRVSRYRENIVLRFPRDLPHQSASADRTTQRCLARVESNTESTVFRAAD